MGDRLKFVSLFSGIGGLDLGLERAGWQCVVQAEKDAFCRKILALRFPRTRLIEDVRDIYRFADEFPGCADCGEPFCERHKQHLAECACIGCTEWEDEIGQVELICGGDPCQENSNARRAAETTSPSLGDEFIRIVERIRPRIVVRENPTAVRADAPWPWWRFRGELERRGYTVLPFRLRACCAGADFRRDRLFLLAELQESEREGLEGHERKIVARTDEGRQDTDPAGSNRWSAAPRICGRVDGISNRMDRLKSLGNSVVPAVGEWIGRALARHMEIHR